MVWTQATIVRASVMGTCIEFLGHFAPFSVVAGVAVIFHIIGNQDLFRAVVRAPLEHPYLIVFKYDFRIHPAQTLGAEAQRKIVVNIGPFHRG